MKVAISVLGRFHAFYLAAELARRDALAQLLTSYPRFAAGRFGVPEERVDSILAVELLARAHARLPSALRARFPADAVLHERYMQAASARLRRGADVFVGWSGVSLRVLERARGLGMRTVLERGSSHIRAQHELLREEFARIGQRAELPEARVIETELEEYALADRIAVPSGFVRDSFLARGVPARKLMLNPYGVSLASFQPPMGARPKGFRILHVGTVSVRKGAHHLMQAFRELALPNAELLCVGRVATHMRPFLERYAGKDLRCLGAVPQSELTRHYQQAQVFCLASIEEGLAMVVPQAMACALPIVASHNTGAGDIARHGREGLLFRAGDIETLKDHLTRLYEDAQLREQLGAAAHQRVQQGFTWNDYGTRALAHYAELLDTAPNTTALGIPA